MDIYPRTDIPDIRRKTTIHSGAGALLIVPPESGFMVHFFMQMPALIAAKQVTLQSLHDLARNTLVGYNLETAHTAWWSADSIVQQLASELTASGRIFLAGDACHTHSPKAEQSMNISLQDGYNIGWKLAYILQERASPKLLDTYALGRRAVAADGIAFDHRLTVLVSARARWCSTEPAGDDDYGAVFKKHFIKNASMWLKIGVIHDSLITLSVTSSQVVANGVSVG